MMTGSAAPVGIMTVFGIGLADSAAAAAIAPLPTALAGTTVQITDSAGVTPILPSVLPSPTQINLLVPGGSALGPATFTIRRDSVEPLGECGSRIRAAGLFSMNASGQGVGAIIGLRVDGSGQRNDVPVFSCGASGKCVSTAIDLGAATDQVYLSLYGTGIRGLSSPSAITVTAGGVPVPVLGAARNGSSPGWTRSMWGRCPNPRGQWRDQCGAPGR